MKGILKIYHPEETLKYHIKSTYCKAVYLNQNHFLDVEIITDDSLDHVDDDSLQYNFPQLALQVSEFPVENDSLAGCTLKIKEEDESYTAVDLFDDEDAYLYENTLSFADHAENGLELCWSGSIDDFYTGGSAPVPFKLKCHFKEDLIEIDED